MQKPLKSPKPSKGVETSMEKKKAPVVAASPKITLLIFCPSEIILAGILRALEADSDLDILNIEKNTIESFIDSIKKLKPQVILFAHMEALPNLREICKAIRDISKDQIKTQMLLLGNIPSHEEIVSLINVGARGYFDLNDPSGQLPEAVRVLAKGEIWLPRDKMSSIMDRIISVVGREIKEKTLDQLTPTEFQVLSSSARANRTTKSPQPCSSVKTPSAPTSKASTPNSTPTAVSSSLCTRSIRPSFKHEERDHGHDHEIHRGNRRKIKKTRRRVLRSVENRPEKRMAFHPSPDGRRHRTTAPRKKIPGRGQDPEHQLDGAYFSLESKVIVGSQLNLIIELPDKLTDGKKVKLRIGGITVRLEKPDKKTKRQGVAVRFSDDLFQVVPVKKTAKKK